METKLLISSIIFCAKITLYNQFWSRALYSIQTNIVTKLFLYQKEQPKDEEEVLENIYRYIDRIFAIVRPRRLLYMAIGKLQHTSYKQHRQSLSYF